MAPVAIVTASDSGIGKAAAVRLAHDGYDVGVTWHADERGAKETAGLVSDSGRNVEVRRLDLLDLPQAAEVIDDLADALGALDVLVNNAGTSRTASFSQLSYEQWRETLRVDLDGAFLCAQRAVRRMMAAGNGGRIVNITSVHEHVPLPKSAAYCTAKAGLGMLTKVMALELAEYGITVNSIAPGEIATAMTGNEDVDPGTVHRTGIPAGRPGDANEIAAAVSYLASEDAAYVTGSSLIVDGGLLLMAAVRNG